MTIEKLYDITQKFEEVVSETGFYRDIVDFVASIQNNQNNILALREMANTIKNHLSNVHNTDLPNQLKLLLPKKELRPFTEQNYLDEINNLIDNSEMQGNQFFTELTTVVNRLNKDLQRNQNEIKRLQGEFSPYVDAEKMKLMKDKKALISLLFKDLKTTTVLQDFSETLKTWNRNILLYHQIVKSQSPDDIRLVSVSDGSLDVLINIDVDVAIDLMDVFKVGLKAFFAYLTYKKLAKPIIDSYMGNDKLIDMEREREKEMINNIGDVVVAKLSEQHKLAIENDPKIDKNPDKKIEQISKQITSHIVKGNEIKLRAIKYDEQSEDEQEKSSEANSLKKDVEKITTDINENIIYIDKDEQTRLLEQYVDPST